MTPAILADIGLQKYNTSELFIELGVPVFLVMLCYIHVHYLHKDLLEKTLFHNNRNDHDMQPIVRRLEEILRGPVGIIHPAGNSGSTTTTDTEMGNLDNVLIQKKSSEYKIVSLLYMCVHKLHMWKIIHGNVIWRIIEVHLHKIAMVVIFVCSVNEMTACHFAFVILLVVVDLPFHKLSRIVSNICACWAALLVFTKTIYQISVIYDTHMQCYHLFPKRNTTGGHPNNNFADYIGFSKTKNLTNYLLADLVILFVLVFESIVRLCERRYTVQADCPQIPYGIVYPSTRRGDADNGLGDCLKYLINYGFYKFGIELCHSLMVVNILYRMDAYSLLYGFLLAMLLCLNRRRCAFIWPLYICVLGLLIVVQYTVLLGIPFLCDSKTVDAGTLIPHDWQMVASVAVIKNRFVLIFDFIHLLFVCQQRYVFRIERDDELMQQYGGGNNDRIILQPGPFFFVSPNPVRDFVLRHVTYLDIVKVFIFKDIFWMSMILLFLMGTSEVTIFNVFLYVACFVWLWIGPYYMIRSPRRLHNLWCVLLAYVYFVMYIDCLKDVLGCLVGVQWHTDHCVLVQLFDLRPRCTESIKLAANYNGTESSECYPSYVDEDWNPAFRGGACVICLLIQLRIFQSYYFQHVVLDLYVQHSLSDKGAALININLLEKVESHRKEEEQILAKIREQVDRIKQKQHQLHQKALVLSDDHFKVIRSGDYYMFDDDSENEAGEEHQQKDDGVGPIQCDSKREASIDLKFFSKWRQHVHRRRQMRGLWITRCLLVSAFFGSMVNRLIDRLNEMSYDYRTVAVVLDAEKTAEKVRLRKTHHLSLPSVYAIGSVSKMQLSTSRLNRLVKALVDVLLSLSEFLCYFMMIINQLIHGSILAMPFPISVYLWAVMSVPRPSTAYWTTMIVYTEFVLLIKFLCRFYLFEWNDATGHNTDPLFLPRLIGVDYHYSYAHFDMALLLVLFIHRSLLKSKGLWRNATSAEKAFNRAKLMLTRHRVDTPSKFYGDDGSMHSYSRQASYIWEKKEGLMPWVKSQMKRANHLVTKSQYNIADDVYFWMFLCDIACVIVVIFYYSDFAGPDTDSQTNYLASAISRNEVPLGFIFLLLFMFMCMLIDRALFLRRMVFGKLIYQIILIIGIHVWMFFILPRHTGRPFAENNSVQLWYFFKCLYFGLSAYQIRCHYPSRIVSNFLMKKPGYTSLTLFIIFRIIPFLLEIRYLMDWMLTDTALGLYHWVVLEDIYNNAFILECFHHGEDQYVTRRATKRSPIMKYGIGGMFLFLLFFIIWFPLVIFSFTGTVFRPQTPKGCTLTLQLGRYKVLFEMKVLKYNKISQASFDFLKARYTTNEFATGFLTSYTQDDIYIADIYGHSDTFWEVAPPTPVILHKHLMGNNSINVYATVKLPQSISRRRKLELQNSLLGPTPEFHHFIEHEYKLDTHNNVTKKMREELAAMVLPQGKRNKKAVSIPHAFPRVFLISTMIGLRTVNSLDQEFINLTLQLHHGNGPLGWWQMSDQRKPELYQPESENNTNGLNDTLQLLLFNDRAPFGFLSYIAGFGVGGLYMSLVLMIGRLVRMLTQDLSYGVKQMETPYVGRILDLCRDIYIARESGELAMEEELFAKLIFIYRSPQTLIRMTRYKTD